MLARQVVWATFLSSCATELAACTSPGTDPSAGPGALRVEIDDLRFDVSELAAPAGRAFEIVVDNRERGIPHNVSVYTDDTATEPIARGTIAIGPAIEVLHVPALGGGSYFFRCDVHRLDMIGTLHVVP
jgi:plastocyanin